MGIVTYTDFLANLGLRYFDPVEVVNLFDRPLQDGPSPELWPNIVKPIVILDALRDRIDHPITLHSTYRTHKYNAKVGGSPRSQHLLNRAIDFSCSDLGGALEILGDWRAHQVFSGGLGLYSTFIHIDTRGYKATWG